MRSRPVLLLIVLFACFVPGTSQPVHAQTSPILPTPLLYLSEDADGLTQVWMLPGDGSPPRQVTHEDESVYSLNVSTVGDLIAVNIEHSVDTNTTLSEGTIKVYRLDTNELVFHTDYHLSQSEIFYRFLADDQILAVGGLLLSVNNQNPFVRTLTLYHLATGDNLYQLENDQGRYCELMVADSAVAVAMTCHTCRICEAWGAVFDVQRQQVVYEIGGFDDEWEPTDIAIMVEPNALFSPDGRHLALLVNGLRILDTATWELQEFPGLEETSLGSSGFAWDNTGRYLAYEGIGAIYVLDLETREIVSLLEGQPECDLCGGTYKPVSFSPNGEWLYLQLYGLDTRGILVVNVRTGEVGNADGTDAVPGWRSGDDATLAVNDYPPMAFYEFPPSIHICDFTHNTPCQTFGNDNEGIMALEWLGYNRLVFQWQSIWEDETEIHVMSWPDQEIERISCGAGVSSLGNFTATEDGSAVAVWIGNDLCIVNLLSGEATRLDFELDHPAYLPYLEGAFRWLPQ